MLKTLIYWECEEDVETATYFVSGNKINITFEIDTEYEENVEWTVKTLNNTIFIIEVLDEDMGIVSAKFTRE